MENKVTLKGQLKKLIFSSPNSSFFVGSFKNPDTKDVFNATGTCDSLHQEGLYEMSGEYTIHPKYGRQLKIDTISEIPYEFKDSVVSFLSSDRFPGIGRKTAEKIYDQLGAQALYKIRKNPKILIEQCGILPDKAKTITEAVNGYNNRSQIFIQLLSFGLSEVQISKMESKYPDLEEALNKNCFDPLYTVPGIGYAACNKIANGFKIPMNDPRRLEAQIYTKIQELTVQGGHTCLNEEMILNAVGTSDHAEFHKQLQNLIDRKVIEFHDGLFYLRRLYLAEKIIAGKLAEHFYPVAEVPYDLDSLIEDFERKENIRYDALQKKAVKDFFGNSIMILNGGPGTGKSTTVKGIIEICSQIYPHANIQLAAPTGRASKRLSALSHAPAKTIHSLLKYDMESNHFNVNESNPLEIDFLIIDEFSMVDTVLFASLLRALPEECRILMIGDEDQLPSVSAGKVFNDLIESNTIPVVSLQTLFRQREGSGIADLAREIREEKPLTYGNGVKILDTLQDDILDQIRIILQDAFNPDETQILAPVYKGTAGINQINEEAQKILNPFDPNVPEIVVSDITYRVNDKVMLKKNMAQLGVYNGDMGIIEEIDQVNESITVLFDAGPITFRKDIAQLITHAWCVSVHKSQGSEFQHGIVVIAPNTEYILEKRLLYTAVTRAKKKLDIVGSREVFEKRCISSERSERLTSLKTMLAGSFSSKEIDQNKIDRASSLSMSAGMGITLFQAFNKQDKPDKAGRNILPDVKTDVLNNQTDLTYEDLNGSSEPAKPDRENSGSIVLDSVKQNRNQNDQKSVSALSNDSPADHPDPVFEPFSPDQKGNIVYDKNALDACFSFSDTLDFASANLNGESVNSDGQGEEEHNSLFEMETS